jgi:hypothetical protein
MSGERDAAVALRGIGGIGAGAAEIIDILPLWLRHLPYVDDVTQQK